MNKKLLISQSIMWAAAILVVGNIYASEALFIGGIHPKRKASRIKNLISL